MHYALYTRVSKGGDVHGKDSELAMKWEQHCKENKDGTLLTSQIMQQSMALRTIKDSRDTLEVATAKRRCQQAAYNALAIAINRTQTSERIFRACLFQDTEKSPLWSNLVDTDKQFELKAEQQRPMAKMRIEDFRKKSVARGTYESRKAHYMASMQLSGSSLSQVSLSEV
ncbi:NUC194 domain-containing protein [Dichotomocladium elegans]|nr:NUC194 domain-containing protein [Dichotomocladium elegans]